MIQMQLRLTNAWEIKPMKKMLLILAALGICAGSAMADPSELSGGVLIAHRPLDLVYSAGEDWCARYADTYAITSSADQINRSDVTTNIDNQDVWFVIAAFAEDKVWCGTQFGLGDFDPMAWYMTSGGGNCLANSLEIPTAGWPAPMTGISIAATDVQNVGNYVPVYWFEGYTYSGDPVVIPISVDPSQDFLGFGNCEAPAGVWSAEGGAMGFFTDGVAVHPQAPPEPQVCCDEFGGCTLMLADACEAAGGIVFDETSCDGFQCEVLVRACCFEDGSCIVMLPANCETNGGIVSDAISCDVADCPQPMAACCEVTGACIITTEADCVGEWMVDVDSCDPNPCDISASDDASWGSIKSMFK